ncbi:MAG: hypothetical protein EXR05_08845 [Acetobacteraceae bacterium]|nr:hypothetical protein [Acetobacteraceae bacterium]MSP29016.1 hypothetical protein [Acetobacteraceae bacterium]
MAAQRNLPALGFLVMAFAIVGLVGVFASFAAPLPLQRSLAREAALDAAGAAAQTPNLATALARLAPQLGDSAEALSGADGANLPARIQAERIAMRARFVAEADALAFRLRLVITLITLSAAGFGVMLTGAISRR